MKTKAILVFLFAASLNAQVQLGKNVQIGSPGPEGPAGPAGPPGITVSCGTSGGCTVPGPFAAQTINNERIAGQTYSGASTIQAAVDDAAPTNASVLVNGDIDPGEMNYPGTEITSSPIATSNYHKYTAAPVEDHRPLNHDASLAQIISLPSLDGLNEGGDVFRATKCAQAGACTVVLVGNSIHENTSAIAPNDSYATSLFQALQRKFPNIVFTFQNLSIGGTTVENFNDGTYLCEMSGANTFYRSTPGNWYMQQTENAEFLSGPPYYQWPAGCMVGSSWKANVAATNPDIVIFGFVENGYGGGPGEYAAAMFAAIQYVQGLLAPSPTVILATDEPPNPNWFSLTGADPAQFESLNEATRGLALRFNLLLADADRYYNVLAYGFDPARRHYQVEHYYGAYPTGWSAEAAFPGSLPSLSGSGAVAATLAYSLGDSAVIQRARNGMDVTMSATFGGLSDASIPSMWYRMDTDQNGYKMQAIRVTSGGNSTYTVGLYYSNGTGGIQQLLSSGTCTFASATPVTITISAVGTRHDIWCNSPGNNDFVHVIGTWDYQKIQAGAIDLGIQVGFGTISNEYVYYGNPIQYFTPIVSVQSMVGTQVPPGFGGSYQGNGDFNTNPDSFGGDGLHHPSPLGMDTYYLAAFKPVLDHLKDAMSVLPAYNVSHAGVTNKPYGGIQDSQDGHVDFVNGPVGGRIASNDNTTFLETWGNTAATPHVFTQPVWTPALAINGGVPITAPNAIPTVGSPAVGAAACIKAAGPPIVIGNCSTAVGSGGLCTCI